MELSEKIKCDFDKSGYSFRELEHITGIPSSSLQRYVSGDIENIPIGRLDVLARALGTTAKEWLGWDTDNSAMSKIKPMTAEFIKLFDILSEEKQLLVINIMKGFLEEK